MRISTILTALLLSFGVMSAADAAINAYCDFDDSCVTAAPEVDPSSAFTALTLLGGVLVVARGRRRR